jgi:mRNA interferase MazF
MAFQKGEVVLVTYPYTDLTTAKARPAVVVSSDLYHAEQPDIVLTSLTSNVAAATGSLDYVLQDWAAAGLRLPTALKPVVVTLDPSLVVHRIGNLSSRDLAEVQARLRLALDL